VADAAALAERFQERVAEARQAALRELAYGAGHEINNPLANIAARAQALLLDEREPERRRRLATIVDQAFRARDMIGGLMVFARPPRPEPHATTLETLIESLLSGLRPQAEARQVELHCRPLPPTVELWLDAGQVSEALRLLAVNAFEAVAEGGRVEISAVASPAATAAEIEICDNGPGMDQETAERACDPFFSGREAGRGIGLGLPKALRLIEANGGRLTISTRPGQGTRCGIWLPLASPMH
jgi:signal transduction histidine kinase